MPKFNANKGKKKSTEKGVTKTEMRDSFLNCKGFTQDQVKIVITEICRQSDIDDAVTQKLTNAVEAVVSNSFSKVMASSGL